MADSNSTISYRTGAQGTSGNGITGFRESLERRKEVRFRESLKKPLGTRIHIYMILAYVVQLVIAIYMYDFLRNFFMMIILSIVIAAPFFDMLVFIFAYRSIKVNLSAPENHIERNSIGYLLLKVINKSFAVSLEVNVKLDVENTFYAEDSGAVFSLPGSARNTFEKYIPISYSMNGIYKYTISTITVKDLLGFVSLKKKVNTSAEVTVYPDGATEKELDMSDMSRGMTESEETVNKGHDFSDVSDVREYIPGDKLMSIHWKLSAKRDILMVKDRVSMSDEQMVILVELSGDDEMVDEILSLTYGVVNQFIKNQTFVRLLWWSEGEFAFEERQIMNLENLNDAFSAIYYEKIYSDPEKTKGYMRSIKPELKAYVNICQKDGEADAIVVEQE
ncbi:MAG: DUF58 domain-containing protein [Eubacterium sp.]|nr:DUF58 domain-containing protein [Eubacterium sp.]